MTDKFLFFCSACSDLDSPSGEICALETYENFPPEKIVGNKGPCLREYPLEPDWHWIPSIEAMEPYLDLMESPLWEWKCMGVRPPSNEEQLLRQAVEQVLEIKRCQWAAHREIRKRLEVFDRISQAKVCRQDQDPLSSRCCK